MEHIPRYEEISVIKLDLKDKRIFKELDRDARMPLSVIAKRVGLSKETVHYRIKKMIGSGLIRRFNTILDIRKIGWEVFTVYIKPRNLTPEKEKKFFKYLLNHPNVSCLKKCLGNYYFIIKLFAKDIVDFRNIMKNMESRFDMDYKTEVIIQEQSVPFSFIYGKADIQKLKPISSEIIKLNDKEKEILIYLHDNARLSLSELARKSGLTRETVKYYVTKMEREKIILMYRPSVRPKKTGFSYFSMRIDLGYLSKGIEEKFQQFVLNSQNVTYFYKSIGDSDVQIEIRAKTVERLNEIVLKIRKILGSSLKRHEISLIIEEPKFTYFPECLR